MKSKCNEINQNWIVNVSCGIMLVWPNINTISPPTLIAFPIIFPPSCVSGDWGRGMEFIFHLPQRNTHSLDYKQGLRYTFLLSYAAKINKFETTVQCSVSILLVSWDVEIEVVLLKLVLARHEAFRDARLPDVWSLHPLIAGRPPPHQGSHIRPESNFLKWTTFVWRLLTDRFFDN